MAAPRLRELERAPGDPLDLARVVLARVEDGPVVANALRAEVETADELADDQHVDVAEHRRTEVRVRVERAAQPEQPLLRAHVGRVELRVADRALQHRGRAEARLERVVGQRASRGANRGSADQPLLQLDVGREQLQRQPRLFGHLRADAVPREEDDAWRVSHPRGLPPTTSGAGGRAGAA